MLTEREQLIAKAQARLQLQKSTTADDPVLVPNTYPPQHRTPVVKYQDTKGNPTGKLVMISMLKFWCATATQIVHMPSGKELKFVNHSLKTSDTSEIAVLRQLSRAYPSKFKEI